MVHGAATCEGRGNRGGDWQSFFSGHRTDYLERGGDINIAKRMAGHSNVKTTEL